METGVYILNLWAAGQSCREAVEGYRTWAEGLPSE